MKEELIAYVWKHRLCGRHFHTVDGEDLEVLHPGVSNGNAGPDFLNARLRIEGTLWAGNVELHWKASDWERHHHSSDPRYNNVILHVVMESDREIVTQAGRKLSTLALSPYLNNDFFARYESLMQSNSHIPCYPQLPALHWPPLLPWLGRLALERLERKAREMLSRINGHPGQWNALLLEYLFRAFGLPVNTEPFVRLCRKYQQVEVNTLQDARLTEALLLHLSGLLDEAPEDDYVRYCRSEGSRLAQGILPLQAADWSLLRMRPHSFPPVRIAMLAQLLAGEAVPLEERIKGLDTRKAIALFDVQASSYWDEHFLPGRVSNRSYPKKLGAQFRTALAANWLAPVLTAIGIAEEDHRWVRTAFSIMEALPPEDNQVTRQWSALKLEKISGTESQGLIELYQSYCSRKKCLECRIGYLILKDQ